MLDGVLDGAPTCFDGPQMAPKKVPPTTGAGAGSVTPNLSGPQHVLPQSHVTRMPLKFARPDVSLARALARSTISSVCPNFSSARPPMCLYIESENEPG